MRKIDGPNERSIRPLVTANVSPHARVHTDEAPHYNWLRRNFAHDLVTHRKGQYVKGDVTTNDVEGVFSHFKRAVIGVHHQISDEHIDKYLDMFSWRWNRREMKEGERVNELLKCVNKGNLTYKKLIRKEP